MCDRLGLKDVAPYQARHSGASIDQARAARSLMETKKRGRWASDNSARRYERHARLGHSASLLSPAQRVCTEFAERHFGELISGRLSPGRLPLP